MFAYHGYPWLIHRLTYRRTNHANLHVRGYKEEGTTTTPFDMVMLNDLDRFHLVIDVIDRVPGLGAAGRPRPPADGGQADRGPGLHPAGGRGRAGDRATGRGRRLSPGTGPRRILVVNAGSSSLKLRVLDPPTRCVGDGGPAAARRVPTTRRACARRSAVRGGRRRRAPGRPRRDAVHGAGRSSTRGVAGDPRADRRWRRSTSRKSLAGIEAVAARAARACPSVACFDTAFHATIPAAAATYALPARVAGALGRSGGSGSTGCRTRTPSRRVAGAAGPGGRPGAAGRHLPPRRGGVARGGARRAVRRHDDGLHAARGAGDGDPVRDHRSRAGAVAGRARRAAGRRGGRWPRAPRPGSWGSPGPRTCGRSSRAPPAATPTRAWRSTSGPTGCGPGSPRWRPSLGGLDAIAFTGGDRRAVGAGTGARRRRASGSWASSWTPAANDGGGAGRRGRAIGARGRAGRGVRDPGARGRRDRARRPRGAGRVLSQPSGGGWTGSFGQSAAHGAHDAAEQELIRVRPPRLAVDVAPRPVTTAVRPRLQSSGLPAGSTSACAGSVGRARDLTALAMTVGRAIPTP